VSKFNEDKSNNSGAGRYGLSRAQVSALEGLVASSSKAISCVNIRVGYKFYRQGKHLVYFKTTNYGVAVLRILNK
jgi:toxin ParE1/3/4